MSNGNHHHTLTKKAPVAVVAVPFPVQGHLNQMLQFSSLVSSYDLPVYYISSAVHNRQAQLRINGLNPNNVAKIHFHDFPTPPFLSPPPNPNSTDKFPAQLFPAATATLNFRRPFAAFLHELAAKFARIVVVHDDLMSAVVQDFGEITNAGETTINV